MTNIQKIKKERKEIKNEKVTLPRFMHVAVCLFCWANGELGRIPQQESPNEVYERFDLPKLDKDKTLALEERYKKDIQKLPKQKILMLPN